MPQGTVLNPNGPQEQEKLGQLLCVNGDIIAFFNMKNLPKYEPVIFDIIRVNLNVKAEIEGQNLDYSAKIPVGILPKDFDVDGKVWPENLKKRWEEEWKDFESDDEIEKKLNCKLVRSVKNHPQLRKTRKV